MPILAGKLSQPVILHSSDNSTFREDPFEAAQQIHRLVKAEKAASTSGAYIPKSFPSNEYETLRALCRAIIPADFEAGGAIEAGVPEFLDLIASSRREYQLEISMGIRWLDHTCFERYGQSYRMCDTGQQKEILDLIAFGRNAEDSGLVPGISFFSLLRKDTVHAFFTSEIGIEYLRHRPMSGSHTRLQGLSKPSDR